MADQSPGTKSRFQKVALVTFVILAVFFLWQLFHSEFRGSSELEELEKEFSQIAPPASTVLHGEVVHASKLTLQVVAAEYDTALSANQVSSHYQKNLLLKGWKVKSISNRENRNKREVYCKGLLDAVVEGFGSSHGARYYFGVRWEQGPSVKTGCE